MRFRLFSFLAFLVMVSACATNGARKGSGGDSEWRSLFNGKDLEGWVVKIHHHNVGENYANTFRVVDGAIQINYDDYGPFNEQYGHLFYDESFSSYHLKFTYRFRDQWQKDAPSYTVRNSGVMFHSQDPKTILKEQNWPISVEYQILCSMGDGRPRPTGNMCSPGTGVVFEGRLDPRHCINSTSKTYELSEWVTGEIIVYRDSLVKHIVNGDTVLQYTKPQVELAGGVASGFDTTLIRDRAPLTEGYIGLQSEGQGIEFKEILIKVL